MGRFYGWCGGSHATAEIVLISQIFSAYYFAHFLIILPIISRIEKTLPLPNSITESVLGPNAAGVKAKKAK